MFFNELQEKPSHAETRAYHVSLPAVESPASPTGISSDPQIERKAALERFRNALPPPSQLMGQTTGFVERIRSMKDIHLKKECAKLLMNHAASDKKKFKTAKKEGKPWLKAVLSLCEELGITEKD